MVMKTVSKVEVKEKVCRRCKDNKKIEEFRTRPNGFTLNQCKKCEGELTRERRNKKKGKNIVNEVLSIISKNGKSILASIVPIVGGRFTISPNTTKVLYFDPSISRDDARLAFSTFAGISRTGINFIKV
jgi:hypothetical protein